jgi:hypothetical protein
LYWISSPHQRNHYLKSGVRTHHWRYDRPG